MTTLNDAFLFFRKVRTRFLLLWLILFLIAGFLVLGHQKIEYKTYVFFTVSPKEYAFEQREQESINSFYLVSAADIFAETMVGWFKSLELLDNIQTDAGITPLPKINARKETRQNVVLFFSTDTREQADRLSEALTANLKKYIANYNAETNTTFSLVNLSSTTQTIEPQPVRDVLVAFAGALLVAALIFFFVYTLRLKQ